MDALDIITDLDNVVPFFQPIFSADEHRVIGYEILGRYRKDGEYQSLGNFFCDANIPEEYRIEVDNAILKKALEKGFALDDDIYLFINREADLLLYGDGEQLLEIFLDYEKKGLDLKHIVIELNERNNHGDMEQLVHLLNYYRTYGIKIALDNIKNDSGKLDIIGQICPHIIKVDLSAMRTINIAPGFQEITFSLSMLARKIGASLLFENIETVYQFYYAWKNGGRFYQGFYLRRPSEAFENRDILKNQLKSECHNFIQREKNKLEARYKIAEDIEGNVSELIHKYRKFKDYGELLKVLTKNLEEIAFRIYICDEEGFQKSPNIFKRGTKWEIQKEYLQKNWSWRPYFLENIVKMRKRKKGILSDLYHDIETDENIRTYSYPLNEKDYLFIDLSYKFLYEHQELL